MLGGSPFEDARGHSTQGVLPASSVLGPVGWNDCSVEWAEQENHWVGLPRDKFVGELLLGQG